MIEQYWQRCRDQACSAITGSTVSAPAFLLAACCHGTRAMKPLILNSSLGYIPKGILKQKRETERKSLILLVELRGLQGTNRGLTVLIPLPVNQLS